MPRLRRLALLLPICASCVWFTAAQEVAHKKTAQKDLQLVTVGHGETRHGHATLIRTYAAGNGTEGLIIYTEFDSVQAAQQQIEEWVKAAGTDGTVTSREKEQSVGGQLISDRTLFVGVLRQSNEKVFVIIRRDGLMCYWIESVSMQVATQVEGLIEHKPPR